jgi:hypothetical protein
MLPQLGINAASVRNYVYLWIYTIHRIKRHINFRWFYFKKGNHVCLKENAVPIWPFFSTVPKCLGAELSFSTGAEMSWCRTVFFGEWGHGRVLSILICFLVWLPLDLPMCWILAVSFLFLPFTHSWLITGFVTRITRLVLLVEQELPTLPEHLSSPRVF